MEKKLNQSLQKTSFWMFAVGFVMSFFNVFFWLITLLYAVEGFGNSIGRALCGIICLILSTYTGYIALQTASIIKLYQQKQDSIYLQSAFESETRFWTYLTTMVLVAISTILMIISAEI